MRNDGETQDRVFCRLMPAWKRELGDPRHPRSSRSCAVCDISLPRLTNIRLQPSPFIPTKNQEINVDNMVMFLPEGSLLESLKQSLENLLFLSVEAAIEAMGIALVRWLLGLWTSVPYASRQPLKGLVLGWMLLVVRFGSPIGPLRE